MNAQQLIIGHLLPITAAIIVLWVVYRLLFVNSNRFRFNRFFLLSAMLLSLALPLMGTLMGNSAPQVVSLKENLFKGTLLDEITITPDGQMPITTPEVVIETASRPHFSLWQILGALYIIGVGVMTLLFLFKLGKLIVLIVRSPKEKRDGYMAVFTGREQGSFSFLRYAIFPNEDVSADIVRHERSHIAHHHSADLLFAELMMILQWFNPFIYKYKKELQSLHEYQADHDVVATGVNKKDYMMLILQQCTAADFSGISNNFSLILTKKRIKMITKNEKAKGLWWRLLATLPVLAVLLIANTKVTAQEKNADDKLITVEAGRFEIFDDDGTPLQLIDTVIYADDGSYIKFETSDGLQPESGEPCKKLTVTSYGADGSPRNNFFITETERRGDTSTYSIEPFTLSEHLFEQLLDLATSKADTVYQTVDEMPKFPGGEQAMFKFIAENVKYPQEAKDKNIAGRVFVNFVVEKDGSVSSATILRGIGGGCDDEAMRVVKSMPKWTPGKQKGKPVRVSYIIPFMFKLDGTESKTNSLAGTIWEGTGTGTKDGVTYTWHSIMQFSSENEGFFIEKLTSQKKNEQPEVVFEDVAMDFEYAFDGKKTGAITPKNGDGTYMDDLPPEGFVLSEDGKTIVFHFYTAKEDTGIEYVTYKRK